MGESVRDRIELPTFRLTVPTHHTLLGIVGIAGLLAVGLDTGIPVIKPNAAG